MSDIALLATTGHARVDAILRAIVTDYEAAFAGRVRGYYVIGSYADGSSVEHSDIDLMLVFKGRLDDAERERAGAVTEECATRSAIRLDLWPCGEANLTGETVALKLGSVLVYGEDIRAGLTLSPLDAYTREGMDAGGFFLRQVLRGAARLAQPVEYPDPAGEFYGYDTVRIPEWYPPGTTRGIKELVTSASRVARALLALQSGEYAGGKGASIAAYRAHIGGAWSDYLGALYANGKRRWGYTVPEAHDDRQLLRSLCAQTLAFERHFFACYRDHLLARLAAGDPALQLAAAERLGETVYPGDAAISAALELLTAADDDRLRNAAGAALRLARV
jgi:predicted nucleotidyltransferase